MFSEVNDNTEIVGKREKIGKTKYSYFPKLWDRSGHPIDNLASLILLFSKTEAY